MKLLVHVHTHNRVMATSSEGTSRRTLNTSEGTSERIVSNHNYNLIFLCTLQTFNDPIHGFIELTLDQVLDVIDMPRLRRIKQTGIYRLHISQG